MHARTTLVAALAAAGFIALAPAAEADSQFLYMQPVAPGVALKAIATSGDNIGGYVLPGVPDGMGLVKDGKNLVLVVNHELSATNKVAAAAKRIGGAASSSTVSIARR